MSVYDQAEAERHWFDLGYWLANYPDVRLNAWDNSHVPARSLRVPWTGPADTVPIVAVEITPRAMQRPSGPMDTSYLSIVGAVANLIPGVGTIANYVIQGIKLGVGIEALTDWAQNHKVSPDDFSPQYSPKAFLVPMPLDRAQIMVSRPWYAPAMVYEFQEEVVNRAWLPTPSAYAVILSKMLPPGAKDPPASTRGEAPLFSFVNPVGTTPSSVPAQSSVQATTTTQAPLTPALTATAGTKPSVAPLVAAGVLLVLGAPVFLVAALAGLLLTMPIKNES